MARRIPGPLISKAGKASRRLAKIAAFAIVAVVATVFVVRAVDSLRGPPLEPWHTYVPTELSPGEIDATDWAGYLAAEDRIFSDVRANVTDQLPAHDREDFDRYFDGAPIYPGNFAQDFNRSFIMEPDGPVAGAVVLLHGLTDAPYSLRHIASLYASRGYVAVSIRMPGHGTVPAGLAVATWEDWMAATRLAIREAVAKAGSDLPLHIVGYSNGGALAVMYALAAISDPGLSRPSRLVLLSPMLGVTRLARFSGLAAWPAVLPPFVKAAWLSILPEYNPFKYNSFPVNAARQSDRLTVALRAEMNAAASRGKLGELPPILTFQPATDFTISARAVVTRLYDRLEANGSELVVYDINSAAHVGLLLRERSREAVARMLTPPPRKYRVTVIGNVTPGEPPAAARILEPGSRDPTVAPLGIDYPPDVYSMSHIAVPFPPGDGLYGSHPDPDDDFGIALGWSPPRARRVCSWSGWTRCSATALTRSMNFWRERSRMASKRLDPNSWRRCPAARREPDPPATSRETDMKRLRRVFLVLFELVVVAVVGTIAVSFYHPPMQLMPAPTVFHDDRVAVFDEANADPEIRLFYATNRKRRGPPDDPDYARVPDDVLRAGVATVRIGEDGMPWDHIYAWSTGTSAKDRPFLHLENVTEQAEVAATAAPTPEAAAWYAAIDAALAAIATRTSSSTFTAPTQISAGCRSGGAASTLHRSGNGGRAVCLANGGEFPSVQSRHGDGSTICAGPGGSD